MTNGATLAADTTIKLNPATSTLKLRVGDEIGLDEADFRLLADAFFAEIENKYPALAAEA